MNFIKNSMLFLIAAFIFTSCVDENQINEVADQQNEYLLKVKGDLEENEDLPQDARVQLMNQIEQDLADDYNPFDVDIDESKMISEAEFERGFPSEDNAELSTRANCNYPLLGNIHLYPCANPGGFSPHNAVYFVYNPDTDSRRFRYMLYRKFGVSYFPMIDWTPVSIKAGQTWSLGGALTDGTYMLCLRGLDCYGDDNYFSEDVFNATLPSDEYSCD